jgi:hypothetical protein
MCRSTIRHLRITPSSHGYASAAQPLKGPIHYWRDRSSEGLHRGLRAELLGGLGGLRVSVGSIIAPYAIKGSRAGRSQGWSAAQTGQTGY